MIETDHYAPQSRLEACLTRCKFDIDRERFPSFVWHSVYEAQGYAFALFELSMISAAEFSAICNEIRQYARARQAALAAQVAP